jgi:RNA polymerase sigma-70 factor (ECF subfamily)
MQKQELDASNRGFLTTRWSRVLRVGGEDSNEASEALVGLCTDYWQPLYHFARRKGHSLHDAQDLTQGFILGLIESDSLARADPVRGRFRSFLIGAFTNFLSNQHRNATALKRGGASMVLSIDGPEGENFHLSLASDAATPEQAYDRAWGIALLARAMGRLRQKYEDAGHRDLFAALQPHLAGGTGRPGYERIGADLGMSESAITAAVHRMRRSYGTMIREEIAATVANPSEIDEELRHLMEILSGPGT